MIKRDFERLYRDHGKVSSFIYKNKSLLHHGTRTYIIIIITETEGEEINAEEWKKKKKNW